MRGNLNSYRFGYHSLSRFFVGREYAEGETEETGWNSFEARIAYADSSAYDPVIGRWLSVDPARQFASPYVGMGNNPVVNVDPDGEWTEFGAAWRRLSASIIGLNPSKIYEVDGEWGYNTGVKNGAGATFNYGKYEAAFWDRHWDRVSYGYEIVWRRIIPDVYFIEGSIDLTFIGGGGAEFGFALPTRGPNAGTLYGYRTFKFQMGLHGGVGLDIGRGDFTGDVDEFNFETYFEGKSGKFEADYIIGIAIEQTEKVHGNRLYLTSIGVGPGVGAAVGVGDSASTPLFNLW